MINETLNIRTKKSAKYAELTVYVQEPKETLSSALKPMIIVCPGGAYAFTSDREAEMVAMQFYAAGFNAAVLRYSVAPYHFPIQLCELGKSVALIRKNAKKWNIDENKIITCGFSAGGHLVASYGAYWNTDYVTRHINLEAKDVIPNAQILCYPVITSGKHGHQDSFKNLLGDEYENKELLKVLSLEKNAHSNIPKTFIWHTFEDSLVPVQNSLLLASALVEKNVNTELHIFNKGDHGLSLGDERTIGADGHGYEPSVSVWIDLCIEWIKRL